MSVALKTTALSTIIQSGVRPDYRAFPRIVRKPSPTPITSVSVEFWAISEKTLKALSLELSFAGRQEARKRHHAIAAGLFAAANSIEKHLLARRG
jgi:hypothetical protein